MEWYWFLLLIIGSLLALFALGLPVAFCFMLINLVAAYLLWGGQLGWEQLTLNMFRSVSHFSLVPLPLFILMGEVVFQSQVAPNMLDALDKWIGRLPGRLSLLAVAGGVIIATLTGVSMASVSMLGSTLVPEMEKRGYKKEMSLGPILAAGGLAILIPPSGLAILLGAIGQISIGKILIAIIIPGLVVAAALALYIIIRCYLKPSLAPPYSVALPPLSERLSATARYILPLGFILFMVIGVMFLGVATPSEAAATGVLSTFILAAAYGRLNWQVVKKSFIGTMKITLMMFLIISNSSAFSQILAFSGAAPGMINFALGLPMPPIMIMVMMQVIVFIMGCFLDVVSIMMITIPLFVPIVHALKFDPVWFAAIMLVNVELATITPPFGLNLFTMKGVAPPDTTMADVYRSALPYVYVQIVVIALIILFPPLALWLPGLMGQ